MTQGLERVLVWGHQPGDPQNQHPWRYQTAWFIAKSLECWLVTERRSSTNARQKLCLMSQSQVNFHHTESVIVKLEVRPSLQNSKNSFRNT